MTITCVEWLQELMENLGGQLLHSASGGGGQDVLQ